METESLPPKGAAEEPVAPAAPSDSPLARDPEAKISFATFTHELVSKHERPLAAALRATLKIRKGDITTAMFTRAELQAKLDDLLHDPDAKAAN